MIKEFKGFTNVENVTDAHRVLLCLGTLHRGGEKIKSLLDFFICKHPMTEKELGFFFFKVFKKELVYN